MLNIDRKGDRYYLGLDAGNSKTHALVVDGGGRPVGFGLAGSGNCHAPDATRSYAEAIESALGQAGLERDRISASALGLAGFDWPSQLEQLRARLSVLELGLPRLIVNDTIVGLVGGAPQGWGVVIVAGSGANCRGRDEKGNEGRTIGHGAAFGDAGSAEWIAWEAVRAVARAWTRRDMPTALTGLLVEHTEALDVGALIEGLCAGELRVSHATSRLVFEAASQEDAAAVDILRRAGRELAGSAVGVIRQLGFEPRAFDVVLCGGLFSGESSPLLDALTTTISATAPRARFVRPQAPPVVGAALLAMESDGVVVTPELRRKLNENLCTFRR